MPRSSQGTTAPQPADALALREKYRPKRVVTLFVGESSPPNGGHFYRADSNLYRAVQAAFAQAAESRDVPSGEAFLKYFAAKGCWLVDLVDRPLDSIAPSERREAVDGAVTDLAELLIATKPKRIVIVKSAIAKEVGEAIALAGASRATVLTLRYPLRQWRAVFITDLAAFLAG
jgi:hypothetical protein